MNIADRIQKLQYNLAKETSIIQDQVIVIGNKEYTELVELFRDKLNHDADEFKSDEFYGTKIVYVPVESFLEVGTDKCFNLWISDYRSKEKLNG